MTIYIGRKSLLAAAAILLFVAGCSFGAHFRSPQVVHAASTNGAVPKSLSNGPASNGTASRNDVSRDDAPHYEASHGVVPKSYGRLVAAIADRIGTGLVFEDPEGVIRFVSITGMKEGQLNRYDQTPTKGGIPKSYGHLVAAVVNGKGTGLIFEDAQGAIRFVTLTGEMEGELNRE
ncbi:MAG: hypothetical protein WCB53_07445 [Terriglobales bacterium]